jgi:outer membrane protein TolC
MAFIASDLLEIIGKHQSITERGRWLNSKRAILDNTELRYKKGLLAGEEWLRVKLDFDNAQNQFDQAKQELDTLSKKYQTDSQAISQLSWPWLKYINQKTADSLTNLSQSSRSFEARIDETTVESSSLSIQAERRRYFPEFALSAGLNRNFDEDRSPSDVKKSAVLSVNLPLFSRFQTESQIDSLVKLQSSQKSIAEYQLAEEKRRKESTIQDIKRLAQRLDSNNSISKLAGEVMEKSRGKFLQGKISANEFNLDESRYISLYDSWLKDIESIHKNFIEICKISGTELFNCMDKLR